MTVADDYFNTPPENRDPQISKEDLIEMEERHAECLREIAEEFLWK